MRANLGQAFLGVSLAALLGCNGGGDSEAPSPAPAPQPTTAVFDPSTGNVPLPNILASATAPDPITSYVPPTGGAPIARPANTPMTPPEALAYVNLREMGGTNAVAGLNAPVYLRFSSALDASTATAAHIKVFQLTPDPAGTESNPLGFTDVSGMFSYQYAAGGTDLFLFPNFPLLPGTRYLYVVTNRVKNADGAPIRGTLYFEALKSTAPLAGQFAALEAVRANVLVDPAQPQGPANPVKLSGYAKVMDDLITATATTTLTSRADIALMGRFITSGAGYIAPAAAAPNTRIPMESALRAFAAGATLGGLPGKSWTNAIAITSTFDRGGTNSSPDVYWSNVLNTSSTAPATVGTVVLGTLNSANLSMDPVLVGANASSMDLTTITGAFNPAAGVTQPFRTAGNLTGFYHTTREVPFVYIAPTAAAPSGGYPLVIFQHGITSRKENILGVAQSLTTIGRAVIAIDLPLHGALAVTGHTSGEAWGQDFMAIGAPLATRSNIQQAAFHLNRLEFTVRTGGFATLGAAAPSLADIKFVGHSLGAIVGAYYLAGNTTLASSGLPYSQATLNNDMKGYFSAPGGRVAYVIQNSPAFGPSVDSGLAAVGIAKNSPTYHNFFQVTQSIVDPADPATLTTPLAAGLPSRLSNRIAIQEAVGDQVIGNPYTRYLGNALGGREVLGAAGAAVAPGFKQLAYTAGGTPPHAAGVVTQFMFTLSGSTPAPKVANAAVSLSDTTPSEGYFQFDQTGIGHSSLLDPSNLTNLGLIQRQMRYFLGITGTTLVVDPTQGTALPITPVPMKDIEVPERFTILGH